MNNKCTLAAIYRGKLLFHIYEIIDQETFKKKDMINLRREVIANGVDNFGFQPGRDVVKQIKFLGGDSPTHLRI